MTRRKLFGILAGAIAAVRLPQIVAPARTVFYYYFSEASLARGLLTASREARLAVARYGPGTVVRHVLAKGR